MGLMRCRFISRHRRVGKCFFDLRRKLSGKDLAKDDRSKETPRMSNPANVKGQISQVIGAVVDVEFDGHLPSF